MPLTDAELSAVVNELTDNGRNDFTVTDAVADSIDGNEFISEFIRKDIESMNYIADYVAQLNEYETEEFQAIYAAIGDIYDSIDSHENGDFVYISEVGDYDDLGNAVVELGYFGVEIPSDLQNYIDYEAIGRDYVLSGEWVITDFGAVSLC